jgi:hypothetical protein
MNLDYFALTSHNWSTLSIWASSDGTVSGIAGSLPDNEDDVYSNNNTIYIDNNYHVKSIRNIRKNYSFGNISAGGRFIANDGISLSAYVYGGSTSCLQFLSAVPASSTLYGSLCAGNPDDLTSFSNAFNNTNTGTFTIYGSGMGSINTSNNNVGAYINNSGGGIVNLIGDVFSRSTGQQRAILNSSGIFNMLGNLVTFGGNFGALLTNNSTFNLTGDIILSLINYENYTHVNNTGTMTVVGNIPRGSNSNSGGGTFITNSGNFLIYGNVAAALGRYSITINNTNYVFVSGNVFGQTGVSTDLGTINSTNRVDLIGNAIGGNSGNTRGGAIANVGTTSVVNVTGNVIGGLATTGIGNFGASSIVNIRGSAIGGNAAGVTNISSGFIYLQRAVGGPAGPLNPSIGTGVGLSNSQNGLAYVEEIEFGAQGASPISGPVFLLNRPNTTLVMRGEPLAFTPTTLFGNLNVPNLFPAASSVREGVVYGNGDFTGTMVVPPREAVQVGVPVGAPGEDGIEDPRGTFVLAPESFWTFSRSNSALNDPKTIGYRIKNLATIASVGQQLGSFNMSPPMSSFNLNG